MLSAAPMARAIESAVLLFMDLRSLWVNKKIIAELLDSVDCLQCFKRLIGLSLSGRIILTKLTGQSYKALPCPCGQY